MYLLNRKLSVGIDGKHLSSQGRHTLIPQKKIEDINPSVAVKERA